MKVKIGSRASKLAIIQSELVMEEIRRLDPTVELELITMTTTGDNIQDKTLEQIGGKGLFVKELDQALLDGKVDITVHSLKDMPMVQDPRLPIAAFFRREDPQDVMVLRPGLKKFPLRGGVIGTSSKRRALQIAGFYPTAEIKPVRGNIQTRLAKLDSGEFDALILAAAGLKRLGLEDRISRPFHVDQLIPAAGQGILGIQCRADADLPFITKLGDEEATACAIAERAFVRTLNGGCTDPSAAHAQISNGVLKMVGYYVAPNGEEKRAAIAGRPIRAAEMGQRLARQLRGDNP